MNRRILFRGKVLDEPDAWAYGNLIQYYDGQMSIDTTYTDGHDRGPIGIGTFPVDPDTVGQFTGMYDVNGCEVFEGDICEGTADPFGIPHPDQQTARYQIWYADGGFYAYDHKARAWAMKWIEPFTVVGNWYDYK